MLEFFWLPQQPQWDINSVQRQLYKIDIVRITSNSEKFNGMVLIRIQEKKLKLVKAILTSRLLRNHNYNE